MDNPPVDFHPEVGTGPVPTFDYRHFLQYLLEKSWVLVLCLLAGLFIGISLLYHTPKTYSSRLVLEVDTQEQHVAPVQEVSPIDIQSLEQLRTIEQNLHTFSLMERVARAADLAKDRDFLPPAVDGRPYTDQAIAGVLLNMVTPVVRRGTRLIDVFVVHTDAREAQRIAQTVGEEYIRQSIERRAGTARLAYDFLREESERLKKKLQDSENALQAYREKNGQVSPEDRANVFDARTRELSNQVTQLKATRLRLATDFEQIERFKNDPDKLMTVPSIAENPTVVELKNQVTAMNTAIANLAQRYKDEHPKMIQAHMQLAGLRANLRDAVLRLPPLLKSQYDNSTAEEKNVEAALADQEKAAMELNKQAIPYQQLQREVDANKALYESVLKRMNETDLTKGIQADPVQIEEPASFSPVAISPQPFRIMSTSIVGALVFGLAILYLLSKLDRTLKTVDQAETILGLPAMGAIPDMKFPAQRSYLLMEHDKNSTAAEAFRSLRASLALLGPEAERRVIIFTSAVPSEGKSFSCTNYSVSLAQQGYRTLLIDSDLRRPSMHKIFRVDGSRLGMTDYLVGRVDLATAATTTEMPNLFLLTGGQKAPNPAELLSGQSFAELVADASRSFDRVVFDSAPLIAVSDTLLMTPYIRSVCLVVRARKTPRNVVLRAIALLDQTGHRPVGFILNRLPRNSGMGYYYYYSEHGYGGDVYGAHTQLAAQEEHAAASAGDPKA